MKPFPILVFISFISNQCNPPDQIQYLNSPPQPIHYQLTSAQSAFLDTLQHRTFFYFWHKLNQANVFVKDRLNKNSLFNIAGNSAIRSSGMTLAYPNALWVDTPYTANLRLQQT